MRLPIVAIIGRPNVGKSTLFNRILHRQAAITDDLPGITRDRNAQTFEWNARRFLLVDTGGFIAHSDDVMDKAVTEQSLLAIEDADTVLFMVDVRQGITDMDGHIRDVLIKTGKPVVLAVTKVDSVRQEYDVYEFYSLGVGEPMPVSGITGRGTGDLLDAVVEALPDEDELAGEDEDDSLKIAVVGRPNVGKSSLVNRLTGKNSVLVTDVPGTTRDPIDTHIVYRDRKVTIVDTAGLKRQAKLKESVDYYSSLRTLRTLPRCDVAILMIDVSFGLTSHEKRLIDDVEKEGIGLIIAANKWDLIEKDHMTMKHMEQDLRDQMADKTPFPMVFTSALTGQRVTRLLDVAFDVDVARKTRVKTADLNRFMETLSLPPGSGDINIYYATQFGVEPPSFAFFINDVRKIRKTVFKYVENRLREAFGFKGTPIRVSFKPRKTGKKKK